MMNSTWKMLFVLASFVGVLSGCIFEGTGTGNPMTSPMTGSNPPSASPPGNATAVDLIAGQLCLSAVRCHADWTLGACMTAIYPLTGFAEKLGVTIEPEPTLKEIGALELAGRLTADGPALKNCLDGIKDFDCRDATPQDTPANLAGWLGSSCKNVERADSR